MTDDRLNKRIFLFDKDVCKDNWSKKLHEMLTEFDMLNYWNNNQPVPLDRVKCKIKARFDADWEHHCSTKPKLRTYTTFKQNTETASHLKCNLPKFERSVISQLRLGILPLRIETGRYQNIPENLRTCTFCNNNAVENEVHFLFECDYYRMERTRLENAINVNLSILNNNVRFSIIFDHPYALGKYVRSALKKRKDSLYRPS